MRDTLVRLDSCDDAMVKRTMIEFFDNGEVVHPMFHCRRSNIDDWKTVANRHKDTTVVYGYVEDDELIGIGRLTTKPKFDANGTIGIAIRPSKRKQGYGGKMLMAMMDKAAETENDLKAVIASDNVASVLLFSKHGFEKSGKTYDWIDGRTGVEFVHR